MKLRILIPVFCLMFVVQAANGLGSLTSVGSAYKKTVYDCVIRSLVEDRRGRLWAGTFGGGLFCLESGNWFQIASSPKGMPDMRISKIIIDGDALFLATVGGGAARMNLKNRKWSVLFPGKEPESRHFHAMILLPKDRDGGSEPPAPGLHRDGRRAEEPHGGRVFPGGRILLGSVGEGVFISNKSGWDNLTESDRLPNNWVNDALVASDGIWLATYDGLGFLRNGKIASIELPQDDWKTGNVNVICFFNGNLFLGSAADGLIERIETRVASETKASYDRAGVKYKRVANIPNQVHSLIEFDDRLWVGTEGGLYSLSKEGLVSRIDGDVNGLAIKSLGIFQGKIVAGTDLGKIFHHQKNSVWIKIFDYKLNRYSGGLSK